jgi:hypothetical protein
MKPAAVPPRRLWLLALGFGLWCSAIVIVYALHALGCAFGWRSEALRWGLGLVLLAHLLAIGWPWYHYLKTPVDPATGETGVFFHWVLIWTLAKAFIALILTLGPIMWLSTCV